MIPKNFEAYLTEIHAKQYTGLDDEMPDDYQAWLGNFRVHDWMIHAELYAHSRCIEAVDNLSLARRT